MSSTPPASGRTVVFAGVTALPGKADELQGLLAAAIASANSDAEPYTLTYRAARSGDQFKLFEEYDQDIGGIEAHKAQGPFQALIKSGIVKDVEIKFYTEFTTPVGGGKL